MHTRRFILGALGLSTSLLARGAPANAPGFLKLSKPFVVSTWDFGVPANHSAWTVLRAGGRALDAVEMGVQVPEADLKNHTVGRAGYPDRDGHVKSARQPLRESGKKSSVIAAASSSWN